MIVYKNIFSLSYSEMKSLKNLFVVSGLQEKIPLLLERFPQFNENQIREISKYDPTPEKSKAYTPWLIKMVAIGNLRLPEDGNHVFEALQFFEKFKQDPRMKNKNNINQYESPGDLYETIEYFTYFESKTQKRKQYEEGKEKEGSELLVDQNGIKILKVININTAMELAERTKWCVREEDYAKTYLRQGPLYFVYQNNEPYALLHVESNQLKDVYDRELKEEYGLELKPYFVENRIIHPKVYDLAILKNYDTDHYTEKDGQILFSRSPNLAGSYAVNVLKRRFPEGEKEIAKDAKYSLDYAQLIGGRFPEGEKAIAKDPENSYLYAKFLGKRFELGEPAIAENSWNSLDYAKIMKEKGEKVPEIILQSIVKDAYLSFNYAKFLKINFKEKSPKVILQSIAQNSKISYWYAEYVIEERFPEGEKVILDSAYRDDYLEFIKQNQPQQFQELMNEIGSNLN